MHKSERTSVLIALAGFKGSLLNHEACEAVASALSQLKIPHQMAPIADGGRGTVRAIQSVLGGGKTVLSDSRGGKTVLADLNGEIFAIAASGPLGAKAEAEILCLPDRKAPHTVVIESSDVCGYHLVEPSQRDPMRATSFGLGEVIKQVVSKWESSLRKVYVGLGDSAVSDAGMGMLSALGYEFQDDSGRVQWGSATGLRQIRSVKPLKAAWIDKIKFTVLCDVLNPLCGPSGSARTFAPQKGANSEQVKLIEAGMENFAKVVEAAGGRRIASEPMTGSAGGMAAGFRSFLNSELVQGARFLMDWMEFDSLIAEHDIVVLGEGKTDSQTLSGKAPGEALDRITRLGKKAIFISGQLGPGHQALLKNSAVLGLYECGNQPTAAQALRTKAFEVFSDFQG